MSQATISAQTNTTAGRDIFGLIRQVPRAVGYSIVLVLVSPLIPLVLLMHCVAFLDSQRDGACVSESV